MATDQWPGTLRAPTTDTRPARPRGTWSAEKGRSLAACLLALGWLRVQTRREFIYFLELFAAPMGHNDFSLAPLLTVQMPNRRLRKQPTRASRPLPQERIQLQVPGLVLGPAAYHGDGDESEAAGHAPEPSADVWKDSHDCQRRWTNA